MSQTVSPIRSVRKAAESVAPSAARTLREALNAHSVSREKLAEIWGVCRTRASSIIDGEGPTLERFALLPASVQADFCRRHGAQVEASPVRSLEGEHLDVVVELGRLTDELRAATADGRVDDAERARIRRAVAKLAGEVADLQRAVAG